MSSKAERTFEERVRELVDPIIRQAEIRGIQRGRRDAMKKCQAAAATERAVLLTGLSGDGVSSCEGAIAMAERLAATFRDLAIHETFLDDEGNRG